MRKQLQVGLGVLALLLVLSCCVPREKVGRVLNASGEPVPNAIVVLQYSHQKYFRLPMDHSISYGWPWRTVVATGMDGTYKIPVPPWKSGRNWWWKASVRSYVYIPPTLDQSARFTGVVTALAADRGGVSHSLENYWRTPASVYVTAQTYAFRNESGIKRRIYQLETLYGAAPDPRLHSKSRGIRFSDRGNLIRAMHEEVTLLCSFWKEDYHPQSWQGERTDLPLLCRDILAI